MTTTVSLEEITKERLEQYRHPSHDNISDVVESLIDCTPTPAEILSDGCANCGKTPPGGMKPVNEINGVVRQFASVPPKTDEIVTGYTYFCSDHCAKEKMDEHNAQAPRHPDVVVIGGKDQPRSPVFGATYLIGENELGFDIPGAFDGESDHGDHEYEYEGEPVYIGNRDQWVQSGVVDDILHEDRHTGMLLSRSITTEEEHEPERPPSAFTPTE